MLNLTLTVSQDWIDRFDAYIRDAEPWEGRGPDRRTTEELFRKWVGRYSRRDIRTYEGNKAAEAVVPVDDLD